MRTNDERETANRSEKRTVTANEEMLLKRWKEEYIQEESEKQRKEGEMAVGKEGRKGRRERSSSRRRSELVPVSLLLLCLQQTVTQQIFVFSSESNLSPIYQLIGSEIPSFSNHRQDQRQRPLVDPHQSSTSSPFPFPPSNSQRSRFRSTESSFRREEACTYVYVHSQRASIKADIAPVAHSSISTSDFPPPASPFLVERWTLPPRPRNQISRKTSVEDGQQPSRS